MSYPSTLSTERLDLRPVDPVAAFIAFVAENNPPSPRVAERLGAVA